MENKSKNYIVLQKLVRLGKVFSKVAFAFSIIGICGCVIGVLSNLLGNGQVLKIGGVTIYGLLADFNADNVNSIRSTLLAWLIVCIGQAVVAKFAELYFRNAEISGTPFTHTGARELRRLGIIMMVIPTGCAALAEIMQGTMIGIMNVMTDDWSELNFDNEASVVVGIMFIMGAFLCGYGAEVLEKNN